MLLLMRLDEMRGTHTHSKLAAMIFWQLAFTFLIIVISKSRRKRKKTSLFLPIIVNNKSINFIAREMVNIGDWSNVWKEIVSKDWMEKISKQSIILPFISGVNAKVWLVNFPHKLNRWKLMELQHFTNQNWVEIWNKSD